ncbi:hypothetical protein TMES_05080 [Thalassospira mesophila]|uniref:Uncharacterized protein n=1 Tax=Thalassospira mesophila TaxID=1293891 RepID=A0A1Y2L1S7_9PROT|nr:hypothetical protein TMES_05080 [Thalassospira mesophila]
MHERCRKQVFPAWFALSYRRSRLTGQTPEVLIVGGTGDDKVIAGCRQGCSDCRPHAAIHPHT